MTLAHERPSGTTRGVRTDLAQPRRRDDAPARRRVAEIHGSAETCRPAAALPDDVDEHGRTLALRMQDETNILIVLERPVIARLPKGDESVDAVRLWVDDPDGFMSAVRTHIP